MCMAEDRVALAQEVDHIIPLRDGGVDKENNFQSLCLQHHIEKTLKEKILRGGG
jgi:5-methylcytosine-specific restriction endonuclease McrA